MKLENQETYKQLSDICAISPDVKVWAEANVPDSDLIWKGGLGTQVKGFNAIADLAETDHPRVVSYHHSKSVKLPVVMYHLNFFTDAKAFVIMRNNFYDVKICVVANGPIELPYDMVHYQLSQEEYDKTNADAYKYHSERNIEPWKIERAKELGMEEQDYWYYDYTGSSIIRAEGKIYRANSVSECYCEGVGRLHLPKELFRPYKTNLSMFTLSAGMSKSAWILDAIDRRLEHLQVLMARDKDQDNEKEES